MPNLNPAEETVSTDKFFATIKELDHNFVQGLQHSSSPSPPENNKNSNIQKGESTLVTNES